jgi:hypothetical protein
VFFHEVCGRSANFMEELFYTPLSPFVVGVPSLHRMTF